MQLLTAGHLALTLSNIAAYSAQVLGVVAIASAVSWLLRLDVAAVRYAYWRALLLLCLLLPLLQGRQVQSQEGSVSVAMGAADLASVGPEDPAAGPLRTGVASYVLPLLAAGAVVRLLWIAASLVRLRRLRRAGDRAPASKIQDELQALIGTRCEIRYVERLRQPATFGLRRPVVLLPASLAASDPDIQRAVLSHELFHVKRRDWAWLLAEEFVCALLWFNPAVWWTVSRIHLAREAVVDELAVLATGRRRAYVAALMAFADESSVTPAAAFGSRRQLFNRIVWLSKESVMSSRRLVLTCASMAVLVTTGGWAAVRAFPLTEVPAAQAVEQRSPGPLEQRAHAVTPENPIPRRLIYEAPGYPVEARDASAGGSVTLMITIDELGRVAEIRRLGLILHAKTPPVSLTLRGSGNTDAEGRFLINGSAQHSDTIRAIAVALTGSAVRAVGQWRYDPPAVGPISFPVTVNFFEGGEAAALQGAAVKGVVAQPGAVRAEGAIRVGGSIKAPVKTRDVRPVYPHEARAAGISGIVILELRINPEGLVEDARVIRSIPALDQSAVDAVMQWRFTPTLLNGQPVPVIMTVTVRFVMDQQVLGGAPARPLEVAPKTPKRQLPAVLKEVKPVYPLEAFNAGVGGSVEVEVTIDTNGSVVNTRVTRSNPMLDDAAVAAARQWTFKPPTQPVVTTIEFTFSTTRKGRED